MAAISGAADIVTAYARGSGAPRQPAGSSTTLEDALKLFGTDATEGNTSGGAQKKRKLNNGRRLELQPVGVFDEEQSVVLVTIQLDLKLPVDQGAPPSVPDESRKSLLLSLESFSRNRANQFTISVWDTASTTGLDTVATCTPKLLDSIAPHLEIAATLSTTKEGKKRSNKSRVPFSRCVLTPPAVGLHTFRVAVEIRWLVGVSVVERQGLRSAIRNDLDLLAKYLPDDSREARTPWALSDFYDAVHMPGTNSTVSPRIQHSLMETALYPFQQRAVDWLLRREGVAFSGSGELIPVPDFSSVSAPVSFRPTQDAAGKPCYVSHLRGMVISDLRKVGDASGLPRGGILAEEMGLGKTVELIALICHHKRKIPAGDIYDTYTGASVTPSGATLIISPPSILEQWKNEINTHAPELKVLHYKGLPPPSAPKKEHAETTLENLLQFDVVLTTYNVLSKEIHFATPPPDRALRNERQYERRKSPLVEISWWRVCLDEAQMVESGVSQAATVARIIPRCNAWAVSGTPLRKDVQDLRGLLIFLRYEPFAGSKSVWDRLDKPSFRTIFNRIALRHTKDKIREELRLPPQKRVVITVPFTAIEEQNYSEMIRQMCDACWLSTEGVPLRDDREADHPEVIERMREWLIRLRQTCLHAHVGKRNRKALGAKNGPLRTVHEVLEVMIDQNDTLLKSEAREIILLRTKLGHIKANAKDVENRSETALPDYQKALEEAQSYVKSCREELSLEKEKAGATSATPAALTERDGQDSADEDDREGDNVGQVSVARKTLRSFLELEHACYFFIGTVHFQLKSNENLTKPDSEDFHRLEKLEVEWYDKAKQIRRELLKESQNRAQRQMKKISQKKPFHQLPHIDELPDLGGIESRKILEMMDNITEVLNAQTEQLQKWRSKIVDILLAPLVDEDEEKETTGDEYEDSTKAQDELYIYIMALRTLVANRNAAVNGLEDVLVEHELKEAEKNAREQKGHAPELVLDVVQTCKKLKPNAGHGSLKGVVSGARSLITRLQWAADGGDTRSATELAIAEKHSARIQAIASEQAKAFLELEKEQEMFRATMNQRLEFYRQLQHISDTVAPWREELDDVLDFVEYERHMISMELKEKALASLRTKHAYLTNLRRETQQEDLKHECIICQDEFEIGVLTSCGHKYCKHCINQWWHAHRTCPLCKQKLSHRDFKDISFRPVAIATEEETPGIASPSQPSTPSSANTSIYSDISDTTMKEIKMIDLDGSYGTKVDMIARHLLWIRNNDPGAKSIIFSQFGDFLEVLREAFRKWKIGASAIRDKDGIHKFRTDPAVECFLLDAKSDSSGLNLVNATYVFLCEPLINPAIELQAIARVHRIGQQRPTAVFMYLVSDTVEEAIYDISVSRRLEHIGRGLRSGSATPALQEKTLDAANSMEMEAAPLKQLLRKKGEGEIVPVDDLWSCLFGKARKQQRAVLDQEVGRHLRAEAAERRIIEAASG